MGRTASWTVSWADGAMWFGQSDPDAFIAVRQTVVLEAVHRVQAEGLVVGGSGRMRGLAVGFQSCIADATV